MAAEFTQPLPLAPRETTMASGSFAGGAPSPLAGMPAQMPGYSPVVGNGMEGTIMGASIRMPMPASRTESVYLRPKPAGSAPQAPPELPPISTPSLPPPPPVGPPFQRSRFERIATYVEDPNFQLLPEDMYDGRTGNQLQGRICKPERGEILLESSYRNQLLDGQVIVYVKRATSAVDPSDRDGWVLENALQRPAQVQATLRTVEKGYQLQDSDSDRLALVPGMQVTVFSPPGSSRSSIPSNTLLVAGVRRDGTVGEPDCFGFVMDSDLAKESIADVPQWPTRDISARSSTGATEGALGQSVPHTPMTVQPQQTDSLPPPTVDSLMADPASQYSSQERQQTPALVSNGPFYKVPDEEFERLSMRSMNLQQRREAIKGELERKPQFEMDITIYEESIQALKQEIDDIKQLQHELGMQLAPLSDQMRSLVAVQRPMEDELSQLRAESFDNLGVLLKLRYLLSRERHRAVDVTFQADAKGVEASRLEVLQRRLDLLGGEQQELLVAKFHKDMQDLHQQLQQELQNRAEFEPLVDTMLARFAAMDDDNTEVDKLFEGEKAKLAAMQKRVEKLEEDMGNKMEDVMAYEAAAEERKAAAGEQDFSGLIRWLRANDPEPPAPAPAPTPASPMQTSGAYAPAMPTSGSYAQPPVPTPTVAPAPPAPMPARTPSMISTAVSGEGYHAASAAGAAPPTPYGGSSAYSAAPAPGPVPAPSVAPVASRASGYPPYSPALPTAAAPTAYPASAYSGEHRDEVTGTVASGTVPYSPAYPTRAASAAEAVPGPAIPTRASSTANPTASTGSVGSASSGTSDPLAKLRATPEDIEIDYSRQIGEGGFGIVYEGVLKKATRVAVKMIKGGVSAKTAQVFSKEVAVWNGLNQRNVLPLLAFCENPPMMVSELVMGGNLRDRLEELGWNLDAGIRFLQDVAAGMSYLHSFGVLHGDLKSLNILIDRGDVAKITDFGLARIREHVNRTTGSAGGVKGTLGFMAPELFDGEPLRPPADVYAFAMVMYEVVSKGQWPFEGLHQMAIIRKVCDKQERPARPEGTPDYIWSLMQRCWADDPASRPTFPQIRAEMDRWPL